jgi:putative ABC transport system permease protein
MAGKSLTCRALALQNARRKPYRNFGLAVLVGIFSAILFGGSILNSQLSGGLESLSRRMGADALIVPYGYELTAKAALLRGEPSTYYMSAEILDKIRNFPGVREATPQFFLASLNSECCSEQVQILGFDPESDFLIQPWLRNKTDKLNKDEIVAGAGITSLVGDKLFFFGQTYRIAAKMDSTGMGLDTSIFMPLPALYDLMKNNQLLPRQLDNPERYISAVAIKVEPGLAPKAVVNQILRQYAIEYNLDKMITASLVSETARRLRDISASVYLAAAGVWLLALFVLSLVFSVTVSERKYELSLYRLLGAKRSWLGRLLLWEAFFLCAGGALGGIALAACIVFPFSTLIFSGLDLPHLDISGGEIAGYALLTLAIAEISGPLACLNTVWSLTRSDVYSSLREGE